AMAVTLVLLRRARRFERNLLKLYLIAYAAYRFATEYLRPEPEIALGLTSYQWVSLAMIALFALLAWRDAPAAAIPPNPPQC
ncbi:MAG: prolipoprotein diacylglyceryl transferase family protein, partial [Planctomycetota bacterium]